METNFYLKIYLNKLLNNKKHSADDGEKFIKPSKNSHFSTNNLYYYFENNDENSFEKMNVVLTANLNLYRQDLLEDLDSTDNLYEVNDDGSYLLSNFFYFHKKIRHRKRNFIFFIG